MSAIIDLIVSFLGLLEAEGRTLRLGLVKAGIALGLVGLLVAMLLAGVGLVIWAIYLFLRLDLHPPTAALIAGFITLCSAGVLLWIAKKTAR